MIHLVNPENPVKVQSIADVPYEGRKTSPSWRKFNCCTDETLCYYLLDF